MKLVALPVNHKYKEPNMNELKLTPKDIVTQKTASVMQALYGQSEEDKKRFMHAVLGVVSQPAIMDCEPNSVLSCIYGCARLSLAPDPVLQLAAIVPYRDTKSGVKRATLQIMYKGYILLARRAAPEMSLNVGTVFENDQFTLIEGLNPVLKITRRWWMDSDEPGEPLFSYCISKQSAAADPSMTIVSRHEAMRIAKSSKAGMRPGTPWHDYFVPMMEKTSVRKSAKLWELDPNNAASKAFREAEMIDDSPENMGISVGSMTSDLGDKKAPDIADEITTGSDKNKEPAASKAFAETLLKPYVIRMVEDFYGEEVKLDEGQWRGVMDEVFGYFGIDNGTSERTLHQIIPLFSSLEPDDIERLINNGAKLKETGD